MRIPATIITGVALVVALSSCGSGADSDTTDPGGRPVPKVAALGPFTGECGNVGDEQVGEVIGSPVFMSYKNSTGCVFFAGASEVTFASYRGSPIDRERAWVSNVGRAPESIEVGGRPGFQGATTGAFPVCDLAVQLDDDFFEWSHAGGPPNDPCRYALQLAELTVERLQ